MNEISNVVVQWASGMPEFVLYIICGLAAVAFITNYVFSDRIRDYAKKHGIEYAHVDRAVKQLAMLAIKLYVFKKGIEDARKVAVMKEIASLIDATYASKSTVRLSELVEYLGDEILLRYGATDDGVMRREIVKEISERVVEEVVKVGDKVNDNEHDPIVKPRDISKWIIRGTQAIR